MARPVCKRFFDDDSISLLQRIRPWGKPRPRWRSACPGPHKLSDAERHFLNQASGTPFDCQAISLSPLANFVDDRFRPVRTYSGHHRQFRGGELFTALEHRPGDAR
jgi:hypothetical protein